MNELYYMPVNEFSDYATFNQLFQFVSKEKQKHLEKLYFDIDKKLSLFAEIIVRIIACQKLNINNMEIIFEKGKYGKPYIKGYYNFHYSISHTRNAIAVAISNDYIGVDIEKVGIVELKIADRFFTEDEQEYINEVLSEKDKRFYEVWTKKEAYIKYMGKGLSMSLNSFNTFNETILKQMKSFEKYGYIISICTKCSDKKVEIVELTETQIKSEISELF